QPTALELAPTFHQPPSINLPPSFSENPGIESDFDDGNDANNDNNHESDLGDGDGDSTLRAIPDVNMLQNLTLDNNTTWGDTSRPSWPSGSSTGQSWASGDFGSGSMLGNVQIAPPQGLYFDGHTTHHSTTISPHTQETSQTS
ncbi:hypothetical protein DXG01_014497, partial [Tephrocybe rancida]